MKKLVVLFLALSVAGMAGATGQGESGSAKGSPIVLKHWAQAGFTPSTNLEAVKPIYERIFREFEEANPGVKIEYEVLPGGTEALQKVLAAGSANQLPDLGHMDGFWIPRLVQAGYLQPLNDLWPAKDRADFLQDVISPVTFDGKIYALWFYNAWRGLLYDKNVVKNAGYARLPELRDDYIVASKKLLTADRRAVMYPGKKTETTTLHMLGYFWGYGGDLVDSQGKPVFQEGTNREALRKTYQWYYDMVNTHKIMPSEISTMDEGDFDNYYFAGQTVQMARSSSSVMALKQNRPDIYGDLGAANYPMPQGQRGVPHLVGWTYAIFKSKDPARTDAAWRFVATLTNTKNLGVLNETHGHIPVRKSIADNSKFFSEDPVFSQVLGIMFGGPIRPRPPAPIYPVVSGAISEQLGRVIKGELTPDQAIDAAAKIALDEWDRIKSR